LVRQKELKNKKIGIYRTCNLILWNNIKNWHVFLKKMAIVLIILPGHYKGTPDLDKTAQLLTYTSPVTFYEMK